MTDLWCVHIAGPDDVLAMASQEAAELEAKRLNEVWAARPRPHEDDPMYHATAAVWPHSPEAHAEDMVRGDARYA